MENSFFFFFFKKKKKKKKRKKKNPIVMKIIHEIVKHYYINMENYFYQRVNYDNKMDNIEVTLMITKTLIY